MRKNFFCNLCWESNFLRRVWLFSEKVIFCTLFVLIVNYSESRSFCAHYLKNERRSPYARGFESAAHSCSVNIVILGFGSNELTGNRTTWNMGRTVKKEKKSRLKWIQFEIVIDLDLSVEPALWSFSISNAIYIFKVFSYHVKSMKIVQSATKTCL